MKKPRVESDPINIIERADEPTAPPLPPRSPAMMLEEEAILQYRDLGREMLGWKDFSIMVDGRHTPIEANICIKMVSGQAVKYLIFS